MKKQTSGLCRRMDIGMIHVSNISKTYHGTPVLTDISLSVAPGECVGLAGENSCGKTTLISIAAGHVKPDSGTVVTEGSVALVPQQLDIAGELTTLENLTLWYAAHRLPSSSIFSAGRPETRLGLGEYARTRVNKLSGGRQKRLSIAIALLGNPSILMLDEPFNMLDIWGHREMEDIIKEQKTLGRSVLLTAHEPLTLSTVCDRVALMRNGRIADVLELKGKNKAEISDLISRYTQNNF
ncbi:MAG: ABC transporter ATP-binding protein [Angelakisella sp.]